MPTPNFIFLSPMPRFPTGGVRVIYKYSEILNSCGYDSCICHPLRNYKYKWFDGDVKFHTKSYLTEKDHLVIAEGLLGQLEPKYLHDRCNFSIFVQNPYYLRGDQRFSDIDKIEYCFKKATSILCVSEDTSNIIRLYFPHVTNKIIRTIWSIDSDNYDQKFRKTKIITYMPRKNLSHCNLVVDCLKYNLAKNWRIKPIENLTTDGVIKLLNSSSIYLSFGSFEGLPAPPVEAAIAGNIVIGYHGNGGKEYWNKPNFITVNVCDIAGYVDTINKTIDQIDNNQFNELKLNEGINCLIRKFSAQEEIKSVLAFADNINRIYSNNKSVCVRLSVPNRTNTFKYYINRIYTKLYKYIPNNWQKK